MSSLSSSFPSSAPPWKHALQLSKRHGEKKTVYSVKPAAPITSTRPLTASRVVRSKQKYVISATYVGEWKEDLKHGFGRETKSDGFVYEGQFEKGRYSGQGVLYKKVDSQVVRLYAGEFATGKRNGKGVAFYSDGSRYEGQFKNDRFGGAGSFFFPNGDTFTGQFIEGERTGFGSLVRANGDVYEGSFRLGKREGQGVYYYKRRGMIFDGEWKDDQPCVGVMVNASEYFQRPATSIQLSRPASEDGNEIKSSLSETSKQQEEAAFLNSLLSSYEDEMIISSVPLPVLQLRDSDNVLTLEMEKLAEERKTVRSLRCVPFRSSLFSDRPHIHQALERAFRQRLHYLKNQESITVNVKEDEIDLFQAHVSLSEALVLLFEVWEAICERGTSLSLDERLFSLQSVGKQKGQQPLAKEYQATFQEGKEWWNQVSFQEFCCSFWLCERTRALQQKREVLTIPTC